MTCARASRMLLACAALPALVALLAGCNPGARLDRNVSEGPGATPPDAFARSTAALFWPGSTRAFQVTPAGDLYNGAWIVRIHPSASQAAGERLAHPPREVAYEDRWCPVAHWQRTADGVRWSFEAFAWPAADSNLFVSLLARATNTSSGPREARLALAFDGPDTSVAFVAGDAPRTLAGDGTELAPTPPGWSHGGSSRPVGGLSDLPARGGEVRATWRLPARGVREARFVLSAYPRPARELAAFARVPHVERAAEARRYWVQAAGRGMRVELGDPDVEHAIAAARITLLGCREYRSGRWFAIGGPFQYRDVWLRDGARAVQALALYGHGREALELASGLRSLQWESGAFLTQRGQPDGTGQALWVFEQVLARANARDSLAAFATSAERAWRWCEAQRATMAMLDPRHRPLMPYADPRDNELARGQLSGTDAWTIAGYAAASRLASAAGHAATADSIERARRAYESVFLAGVRASRSPDVPSAWDRPARDWGAVAALYPCRVGADAGAERPDWDRRCRALARRLWARGDRGMVSYGTPDSLHSYLGADLGDWALLAGERDAADRVLGTMLDWRTASGGWPELFSRSQRDYGRNLPPHATSAAAFLTLVRNALVCDEGTSLMLTLGAREAWWRGAKLSGAPTRWGVLDVTFVRRGDEAEWTWTPVAVPTLLRLPPGTVVSDRDGGLASERGSDHIVIAAGIGHAVVRLAAAGGGRAAR